MAVKVKGQPNHLHGPPSLVTDGDNSHACKCGGVARRLSLRSPPRLSSRLGTRGSLTWPRCVALDELLLGEVARGVLLQSRAFDYRSDLVLLTRRHSARISNLRPRGDSCQGQGGQCDGENRSLHRFSFGSWWPRRAAIALEPGPCRGSSASCE